MSTLLASYFQDLLKDHDGGDQEVLPELVDDNARLPSPCFGGLTLDTESERLGSCHTRSTISTFASTISDNSCHSHVSAGSTGSNSSAGSCRWDSNPSSTNSTKEKSDTLRRPKRPGRKTSDMKRNNHSSNRSGNGTDRPVERPSRSNSGTNNRRMDKPQRPNRTSSDNKQQRSSRSSSKSQQPQRQQSADSLDKMLLQCSKQKLLLNSEHQSDSNSDNSLKEIFRSASHSRRSTATTVATIKPLPGTRTSPPRTVNEILGASMDELKIAW